MTPGAALVRAVCQLMLAGASLWYFVCQLLFADAGVWIASNALAPGARWITLGGAVAVASVIGIGSVFMAYRAPARAAALPSLARLCAPLALSGVLPLLLYRPLWKGRALELLVLVAALARLLEIWLRACLLEVVSSWKKTNAVRVAYAERWLERMHELRRRWPPPAPSGWALLVFGLMTYYALRISSLTLLAHHTLQTQHSDLAEFDNLFFNALHGHPFRAPASAADLKDWGGLKTHAEFLLYLLLPFYAIAPGAEALLVIQSFVVALTALPIYGLAAGRLGKPAGALVAAAYLLMPATVQANFYDFHFTPVGMLCVSATLYFLDRAYLRADGARSKRHLRLGFLVCFGLALLSREDVALGLALAGLLVAGHAAPRVGFGMLAAGVVYFVVVRVGIMPRFGTMWFSDIYRDLKAPGLPGYGGILATLLSNPGYVLSKLLSVEKLVYVLQLAVPLACLWWRRPSYWLALVPGLGFTLLVTNRTPMYDIAFQYVYHHLPYIFAASVLALEALARRSRVRAWAALGAVAFSALVTSQQYGALFGQTEVRGGFSDKALRVTPQDEERMRHLASLLELIPPQATVAASERVGPHVSARLTVMPLMANLPEPPEFVLYGYFPRDNQTQELVRMLEQREYGVVRQAGDLVLLRRNGDTSQNKRVLQTIKRLGHL